MQKTTLLIILLATSWVQAQPPAASSKPEVPAKEEKKSSVDLVFNPEASVVTNHTVSIKGQPVPYKAVAGTIPV